MSVVGPGAVQDEQIEIKPTLEGANEYEFVTILNPLPDDFAVRVAQDIPINMPFNIGRDPSGRTAQTTVDERSAAQTYGLSLKNPDFAGRKHITNDMIIKAGQTMNLKGDQAQVAVRQLVNEIAQREKKTKLLADPNVRKEIEDRIVQGRGSIQDLMDNKLQSTRTQADEAIKQSNEVKDEPFPELKTPKPKKVGRPKKPTA